LNTQDETEMELKENLIDLSVELTSGAIPNVRKVSELEASSNSATLWRQID
jgi:hypothetical protein